MSDRDMKSIFAMIERALALPVITDVTLRAAVGAGFEKECPVIYKMLQDRSAHPRLRSMLATAVAVDNGDMPEHDASVKVGTTLVNDFVKGRIRR